MIYVLAFLSVFWDYVFLDVLSFFPAFLGLAFYRRNIPLLFLVLLIRLFAIPGYWYIFVLIIFLIFDALREHFSSVVLPAAVLVAVGCLVGEIRMLPVLLSATAGIVLILGGSKR
ncbi:MULTISPECIES: hypothetical protein [unclassified Thermotoga]|uniref:hypothetical protein n=1 Tax=unclassified Thermotoga TaxID=2631113 RepID=UPI000280EAC7|nr:MULTISPECIES: hypothetical protein [unclassified Thermotoga]EJX26821.1 hypothetical protein EMP_01052 [Thermotoga sp. EMP]